MVVLVVVLVVCHQALTPYYALQLCSFLSLTADTCIYLPKDQMLNCNDIHTYINYFICKIYF